MPPKYPEGNHRAVIVGQDFDDSQYGLQFVLRIQLEDDGERTVYLQLTDKDGGRAWSQDKSVDISAKSMSVINYLGFRDGEGRLSQLDPKCSNFHNFEGIAVEAHCKHKPKDDGTVERWFINVPYVVSSTPADSKSLRKLDSLFGKEVKAWGTAPTTPPTVAPAPESPTNTLEQAREEVQASGAKDNIPF